MLSLLCLFRSSLLNCSQPGPHTGFLGAGEAEPPTHPLSGVRGPPPSASGGDPGPSYWSPEPPPPVCGPVFSLRRQQHPFGSHNVIYNKLKEKSLFVAKKKIYIKMVFWWNLEADLAAYILKRTSHRH